MDRSRIEANLNAVHRRIEDAAQRSGRVAGSVHLVAVTKKNPSARVRPLVDLGQKDLGENYPQELWSKVQELTDLDIRWHLIGHLQTNKARKTYPMVRMVHAIDSLKLLKVLDELAASMTDPAPVCLQINCSNEKAKHGWSPEGVLGDAENIASCRNVPIVGLMTMAGYGTDAETARPAFVKLRETRDALQTRSGLVLPDLSMGMSGDFEAAIREGATWVRVGSALFEGVE